MSKQSIRKFRKNDWSEDEGDVSSRPSGNKKKERRLERALRVMNVEELEALEDEGLDPIDVEDDIWPTDEIVWKT